MNIGIIFLAICIGYLLGIILFLVIPDFIKEKSYKFYLWREQKKAEKKFDKKYKTHS